MLETTTASARDLSPNDRFTGPFFIVGMHRSGTKLIRDLLRGHPRVGVPPAGTQFLPRWVAHWQRFGDLSDRERFARFYRWNQRTPYFLYLSQHEEGTISENEWYDSCRTFTPAAVFEALVRRDVDAPPESDIVWGDRSPDYIDQIPLLVSLFPQARVIHIVRDARDRCLSIQRRNGAGIARAAQRWADGVGSARRDGRALGDRYLDVRYEDLISNPERELRRCCELIGVEFDHALTTLKFTSEHTGDARGAQEVVAGNTGKYKGALSTATIRRIEEIAGPELRSYGYPVEYDGPTRPVSPAAMKVYRLLDGVNYVRRQTGRLGLKRNLELQFGRLTRN